VPEKNDTSMQDLRPTVWIGKQGCTETMIGEIVAQLKKRKLIKVKWLQNTDVDPAAVASEAKAKLVEVRGRTMVLGATGKIQPAGTAARGTGKPAEKPAGKSTGKPAGGSAGKPAGKTMGKLQAKGPAKPTAKATARASARSPPRPTEKAPAKTAETTKPRQTGAMKRAKR
jgi:RNA-binding protein